MNKKQIIKRVNSYIEKASSIGKKSIKITNEMLLAGIYLQKNGATIQDIQKFYKEEYGVDVSSSGIRKRFAIWLEQNKDGIDFNEDKIFYTQEEKNEDAKVPKKKENNTDEVKRKESINERGEPDSANSTGQILVIDGVEYKKKERAYSFDDVKIEQRIDEIEKQMEDGGVEKYNFSERDWAYYTCRYEPREELRKCILNKCSIKEAPESVRGAYYGYALSPKDDIKHLQKIAEQKKMPLLK